MTFLPHNYQSPKDERLIFNFKGLWPSFRLISLEDVDKYFYAMYRDLIMKLRYDSILDLRNAIDILLGKESYTWGEVYPDDFSFVEYLGWEECAKLAYDRAVDHIKSEKISSPYAPKIIDDIVDVPIYPPVMEYCVRFGDILLWAINERLPLAIELEAALQIFKNPSKFCPGTIKLRTAFQVLWFLNPNAKCNELYDDQCIKDIKECEVKSLANHARVVDPRPSNIKKKGLIAPAITPYPIKKIPNLIKIENDVELRDLKILECVCKEISRILRKKNPSIKAEELCSHELIQFHLNGVPPVIRDLAYLWVTHQK